MFWSRGQKSYKWYDNCPMGQMPLWGQLTQGAVISITIIITFYSQSAAYNVQKCACRSFRPKWWQHRPERKMQTDWLSNGCNDFRSACNTGSSFNHGMRSGKGKALLDKFQFQWVGYFKMLTKLQICSLQIKLFIIPMLLINCRSPDLKSPIDPTKNLERFYN